MNETNAPAKPPKGQIKCNLCHKNCQTKNGDWFLSLKSTGQIFLCKDCESRAKGAYKRAHTQSQSRL